MSKERYVSFYVTNGIFAPEGDNLELFQCNTRFQGQK